MPRITSTFNRGREGWGVVDATLEREGGRLVGTDTGASSTWFFQAGREWRGDLSDNFGGELTYRIREADDSGTYWEHPDVRITGANGLVLTMSFDAITSTAWSTFSVRLDAYSGWRVNNGRIATEEELRDVLADVANFEIRGEYRYGDNTTELTSVELTRGRDSEERPDISLSAAWSTFDSGAEGWGFRSDVREFYYRDTGGYEGGYLEAVDYASGGIYYFLAPDEFEGHKAGYFGGRLSFRLQLDDTSFGLNDEDVIIEGANGLTIVADVGANPGTSWTSYEVALDETGGWRIDSLSGAFATDAQILSVLSNIESLEIRGEFRNGAETTGLDHVFMSADEGRYHIIDPDTTGSLYLVTDSLNEALAALENGQELTQFLGVGRKRTIDTTINADDVTLNLQGKVGGKIALGNGVRNFTMESAGSEISVKGNGRGNTINVENYKSDGFTKIDGGGGSDVITLRTNYSSDATAVVIGGAGDDILKGGAAGETFFGGRHDDTIDGGGGNDALTGGSGNDTFRFRKEFGRDRVVDFDSDQDTILIRGIDGVDDISDLTFGKRDGHLAIIVGDEGVIILEGLTRRGDLDADDILIS